MACPEVYAIIYVVNNPCSCYIDTCSKKIQSEKNYSNQDIAPRHIQKLVTSVVRAGEGCSRRRNKTLSLKLPSRLSQLYKESSL